MRPGRPFKLCPLPLNFQSTVKRFFVFKNVMVYRIGPAWSVSLEQLEAGLQAARFVECGLTQEKSVGWVEPRGEAHGPLVESIGGQWLLKLMLESKAVPGSVINRKTKEAYVVHDAAESEISALALDKAGNLYAATAEAMPQAAESPMSQPTRRLSVRRIQSSDLN